VSGPYGEDAPLYTRVALGVTMWPLALRGDPESATLRCAACDDVSFATAGTARVPVSLAELALSIEAHLGRCRAVRVCDG
jgi:hypothetical protein